MKTKINWIELKKRPCRPINVISQFSILYARYTRSKYVLPSFFSPIWYCLRASLKEPWCTLCIGFQEAITFVVLSIFCINKFLFPRFALLHFVCCNVIFRLCDTETNADCFFILSLSLFYLPCQWTKKMFIELILLVFVPIQSGNFI